MPRPVVEDEVFPGRDRSFGVGGDDLETVAFVNPLSELSSQFNVASDVVSETFDPVVANDEPELQRAEASAKRDLPVSVVNNSSRLGGLVAQVLREHTERLDQARPILARA